MRYIRFCIGQRNFWGTLLPDGRVQPLSAAPYMGGRAQGDPLPVAAVRLLAPAEPSKIVAVGKSYREHIAELDKNSEIPANPIIFIKPPTCVNGPDCPIIMPPASMSQRIDYEGELALVISRTARNVKAAEALDYVLGYTCFNDVTARDLQKKDGQWTRAKGFDSFAPIGPVVTDEVDPENLHICTRLNGKIVQDASTSQLIWPVRELIAFISGVMTLLPGDVISTGTPSGIGPMQDGDEVEVSIEGIGDLKNWAKASI
jgi:2-keto-4-pentenoate hydratase/2-oxohepta-3-ene-1,7-dioic acid hydratase in catechol pathway